MCPKDKGYEKGYGYDKGFWAVRLSNSLAHCAYSLGALVPKLSVSIGLQAMARATRKARRRDGVSNLKKGPLVQGCPFLRQRQQSRKRL